MATPVAGGQCWQLAGSLAGAVDHRASLRLLHVARDFLSDAGFPEGVPQDTHMARHTASHAPDWEPWQSPYSHIQLAKWVLRTVIESRRGYSWEDREETPTPAPTVTVPGEEKPNCPNALVNSTITRSNRVVP